MKKAYLFDIDGTLLNVRGIGRKAFEIAFEEVFGKRISMEEVNFSGRTDKSIVYEALEKNGFGRELIEKNLAKIYETYIKVFQELVMSNHEKIIVFPGVKEVLENLKYECIGLLTGNLMESAYVKLKVAGLSNYFPYGVGAFGNESRDRIKLYKNAIKSLKDYYGVDSFKEVWIIGDTKNDILCAKKNNAKSLIVATGKESRDELLYYNPDYLFDNFSNTAEIISVLKG